MAGYLKHQAAQFALEQLMKMPAGEKLQQALQLIQIRKGGSAECNRCKGSNGSDPCRIEENCRRENPVFVQ